MQLSQGQAGEWRLCIVATLSAATQASGAADLLKAVKAGDQAAIKAASDKWYANGDQIATFLSNANSQNWLLDTLKAMMKTHLDTTLAEALTNLTSADGAGR